MYAYLKHFENGMISVFLSALLLFRQMKKYAFSLFQLQFCQTYKMFSLVTMSEPRAGGDFGWREWSEISILEKYIWSKKYNWQEETLGRGPRPRVSRVSGMRARLGFYWVRGQGQESALVETRSGVFTWPGYRPLIGQEWSRDLDTGLSLVRSDHVTWILASHWSRVIPWSGY